MSGKLVHMHMVTMNPIKILEVRVHFPVILLLLICLFSACSNQPLLQDVTVTPSVITPNADGDTDLAKFDFTLNQNAIVSIHLLDEQGNQYDFRTPTRLSVSEEPYSVLFAGVVNGFILPEDNPQEFEIIKRVLPDGLYTWFVAAETEGGTAVEVQGQLHILNSDTVLPGITGLSVYPNIFSPNQDGIADRTTINLTLTKDVEDLTVFLVGEDGIQHYIAEDNINSVYHKGWYEYDYDGGIDAGSPPPPDGTYTVNAVAQDKVGQQTIARDQLTITNAGLPRAYIVNGDVQYSTTSLVLDETLCFTLTVENDSETFIRTTGPWPGTVYKSDENYNTQGYSQESGVFRIGMDFDTSLRNYPFRWGIGRPNVELVQIDQYWYLPPAARSEVTGCVQITSVPIRNPLYYWMGLIHEDVEIAAVNNNVDPLFLTIWEP
jgi:CheY-like chemotaxis protein